jgi:hypothetical protein
MRTWVSAREIANRHLLAVYDYVDWELASANWRDDGNLISILQLLRAIHIRLVNGNHETSFHLTQFWVFGDKVVQQILHRLARTNLDVEFSAPDNIGALREEQNVYDQFVSTLVYITKDMKNGPRAIQNPRPQNLSPLTDD